MSEDENMKPVEFVEEGSILCGSKHPDFTIDEKIDPMWKNIGKVSVKSFTRDQTDTTHT
jgi:hypothetical protein